jgi:hypothetical protein
LADIDVQHEQSILKFVRDFHSPFTSGRKGAIDWLEYATGGDGRLMPCGMPIRKFFAFVIDLSSLMENVKKVPRHNQVEPCVNWHLLHDKFGFFRKVPKRLKNKVPSIDSNQSTLGIGNWGCAMQDMKRHLDKLQADAAECALISNLATDREKRDLFAKMSERLSTLAKEMELAIDEKNNAADGSISRGADATVAMKGQLNGQQTGTGWTP